MQVDNKILGKIKKCLALSQSSEPHEAAAALRQAQKLMEAHGVSQLDIGVSEIGEDSVKSKFSVSNIKPFEGRLINMISKAFGCKLLFVKGNSYAAQAKDTFATFKIIGVKSNVEMAQYTCEVMLRKLYKARSDFSASMRDKSFCRQYITKEADGFCMGWVESVTKTIHEFANPVDVEKSIDLYMNQNFAKRGIQHPQKRRIGDIGFAAGQVAGRGESIHRPMNGQDQKRLH